MAHIEKTATLVWLSDTELTVAEPTEDIRDRQVVDRNGDEIGEDSAILQSARGWRASSACRQNAPGYFGPLGLPPP
jgi:hypothetical protein